MLVHIVSPNYSLGREAWNCFCGLPRLVLVLLLFTALIASTSFSADAPDPETLVKTELYFGLSKPDGGIVSANFPTFQLSDGDKASLRADRASAAVGKVEMEER